MFKNKELVQTITKKDIAIAKKNAAKVIPRVEAPDEWWEGATEEGVTDEGVTDEGVTDEGVTDEGVTDEGAADELSGDKSHFGSFSTFW